MADTRRRVERLIDTDPVIKKGLQRGIINTRALARFILDDAGLDSTEDAVLGIIRRYSFDQVILSDNGQSFRDCKLVLTSHVGLLEADPQRDVVKQIAEFASVERTTRGENVTVAMRNRSVRVIADQRSLERLQQSLSPKNIIRYSNDLSEISILLPPDPQSAKRIIASFTSELALNDISVEAMTDCSPELSIVVKDKEAGHTLDVLQRMLKETVNQSRVFFSSKRKAGLLRSRPQSFADILPQLQPLGGLSVL